LLTVAEDAEVVVVGTPSAVGVAEGAVEAVDGTRSAAEEAEAGWVEWPEAGAQPTGPRPEKLKALKVGSSRALRVAGMQAKSKVLKWARWRAVAQSPEVLRMLTVANFGPGCKGPMRDNCGTIFHRNEIKR
jgi:hypothetical protein